MYGTGLVLHGGKLPGLVCSSCVHSQEAHAQESHGHGSVSVEPTGMYLVITMGCIALGPVAAVEKLAV